MSGDNKLNSTSKSKKIQNSLFKNKFFWIFASIVLLFIFLFVIFFSYKFFNKEDVTNSPKKTNKVEVSKDSINNLVPRNIDGILVDEEKSNPQPVALMIDNHYEARPSAGLADANLVIEAEVEGRITRYMAVYVFDDVVEKIGPIRSARPYYVDWANEYSAVYGHCGGSPEALVKIVKDGLIDLNEFYNGQYFWRDKNGAISHNLYTSSENLKSYLNKKELDKGTFLPWEYKDDLEKEKRSTNYEIEVNYLINSFKVMWRYDLENNNYIRYLGGKIHKDISGEIITAKNVLIQNVEAEAIDDLLRLRMEHIGKGVAKICMDGECVNGSWKKTNSQARTRFYLDNGKEAKLNRGNTWINVVRPEIDIKLK